MAAIILDDHKELFRSEADFEKFVSIVKSAGNNGGPPALWAKGRDLTPVVDPKTAVVELMTARIIEEPEILDDIVERLKSDDVVDWE